jgi:hypothetical protein
LGAAAMVGKLGSLTLLLLRLCINICMILWLHPHMPAKKVIRYLFNLFKNSFPFYTCFLTIFENLEM